MCSCTARRFGKIKQMRQTNDIDSLGFSLIEILVVMVLGSVVSLAIGKMIVNMQKDVRGAETAQDVALVYRSIIEHLARTGTCAATFAGKQFSSPTTGIVQVGSIKNVDSTDRWISSLTNPNMIYGSKTLKLGKITLTGFTPDSPGDLRGKSKFKVEFLPSTSKSGTFQRDREFDTMTVFVKSADPASPDYLKIENCYTFEDPSLTNNTPYPSHCELVLGHSDNFTLTRTITLPLDKAGYMGLRLTGDVNGDDRFFISGKCTNVTGGSLEDYLNGCSVDIGIRDATNNYYEDTNKTPSRSASHSLSSGSGSMEYFQCPPGDNVNDDDSFYFRMRCPSPTASQTSAAIYLKNNCHLCFGHSDMDRPLPDTKLCRSIQDVSDDSWGRFRLTGHVTDDDIMFIGFYCRDDAGSPIRNIRWNYY